MVSQKCKLIRIFLLLTALSENFRRRYHRGKGVGEGGGGYLSRITPIMEKYNKILTTLASILLSFDLRKSEVEEREKTGRIWCHNYLFLMSLLLVSNDINHHRKFQRKITRHAL